MIETFLFNSVTPPTAVHKSNSELTLNASSNDDIHLRTVTSIDNNLSALTGAATGKKRHKGSGGIVAEGGQFDHLINAYRKYLYNTAGNKSTTQNRNANTMSVAAVGVRFKLDNILSIILKFETRQAKLQKTLLSNKSSKAKGNTTADLSTQMNAITLRSLLHAGQVPDVLVVSAALREKDPYAPSAASRDSVYQSVDIHEGYSPAVTAVTPVIQQLRSAGLRASSGVHQLQGFVPSTAYSLCCKLGIPYLIVVDSGHSVRAATNVFVQVSKTFTLYVVRVCILLLLSSHSAVYRLNLKGARPTQRLRCSCAS